MPRILCRITCVTLFILCVATAFGEEKPAVSPEDDKAAALVRQLGSDVFTVREKAANDLLKMGRPAKNALEGGLKNPDLEVQTRCRDLLVVILDLDFKARLEAFIADKDGKQQHDLPCWQRYRKLVGEDAPARELFIEMARTNRQLLEDAEASPKKVGDRLASEIQTMFQRLFAPLPGNRKQLTLPEVALMLFIASDPQVTVPEASQQMTANLLYQPAFTQGLRNGPNSAHLRKLFGAWIGQATGVAANQALSLSMQNNLKEGLELALKLIKEKDFANGMALAAVGKLGGKEHLGTLEPLLKNATVLTNFNFNNQAVITQVRDVALAMMVHLTGQNVKDYGYEFARNVQGDQLFYSVVFLGFGNDTKRDAAFKKWQEWSEKQPKQ